MAKEAVTGDPLLHGVPVTRVYLERLPEGFTPLSRVFEHMEWQRFMEWILRNGHWNEVIVDEMKSSTYSDDEKDFALYTPYQWQLLIDGSKGIKAPMRISCYMGESAMTHYRLTFGDD
jgi:hypothetical protein